MNIQIYNLSNYLELNLDNINDTINSDNIINIFKILLSKIDINKYQIIELINNNEVIIYGFLDKNSNIKYYYSNNAIVSNIYNYVKTDNLNIIINNILTNNEYIMFYTNPSASDLKIKYNDYYIDIKTIDKFIILLNKINYFDIINKYLKTNIIYGYILIHIIESIISDDIFYNLTNKLNLCDYNLRNVEFEYICKYDNFSDFYNYNYNIIISLDR